MPARFLVAAAVLTLGSTAMAFAVGLHANPRRAAPPVELEAEFVQPSTAPEVVTLTADTEETSNTTTMAAPRALPERRAPAPIGRSAQRANESRPICRPGWHELEMGPADQVFVTCGDRTALPYEEPER